MTAPDLINSSFILVASCMLWNNVRTLAKHRKVKGVSILTTAFFAVYGCWSVYYYAHLNQIASLLMNLIALTANTVWVVLALWHKRKGD